MVFWWAAHSQNPNTTNLGRRLCDFTEIQFSRGVNMRRESCKFFLTNFRIQYNKFVITALLVLLAAAPLQLAGQTTTLPKFGHVVIVLEENTNYSSVVGSSNMPYLNSLINQYGLATNYYADTHPSIGNYFALTTGQIITNNDGYVPPTGGLDVDNIDRKSVV